MFKKILSRREQEQSVKDMGRLPPGQSLTQKFPVLHYGPMPQIDLATWEFKVLGFVEEEKSWNWEEFNKLPKTKITVDLHCVTRWSKFDTLWEGVSLGTLVKEGIITPKPEAKYVVQHCYGGYTTNTPIELILQDNFLLATHFDGKPVTLEHGYPMRGLIGAYADSQEQKSAYLWKGGKWLHALDFRAEDQLGFWERGGYHNEADPWKEQRFRENTWMGRF